MALITCSDCGKEISDRAKACPNCGAPMRAEPDVQKVLAVDPSYHGGQEAARGCMLLATSRPLAYIAFILAWMFGGLYLAQRRGYYVDGAEAPLSVGLAILVLPFFMAYVLRKPIQKVVPMLLGSGCMIILLIPALILTYWVVGALLDLII